MVIITIELRNPSASEYAAVQAFATVQGVAAQSNEPEAVQPEAVQPEAEVEAAVQVEVPKRTRKPKPEPEPEPEPEVVQPEPEPEPEVVQPEPEAVQPEPDDLLGDTATVTMNDLRAKLSSKLASNPANRAKVIEQLGRFNTVSLPSLLETHWGEMAAFLNSLP